MTHPDTPLTPDIAKIRKQIEHAHHHPEEWYQAKWIARGPYADVAAENAGQTTACGTVACIAGRTALDAGWTPHWGGDVMTSAPFVKRNGNPTLVRVVAQDELGLTEVQADLLFAGSNTLRDLYRVAGDITGGEISIPDDEPLPDGS